MPKPELQLDFEQVVAGYADRLNLVLRGFGTDKAGLETWVHDEDPGQSALSMIESCKASGYPGLHLRTGDTPIDLGWLVEQAMRYGQAEQTVDPMGLRIRFQASENRPIALSDIRRRDHRSPGTGGITGSKETIANCYHNQLMAHIGKRDHEGILLGGDVITIEGGSLTLEVIDGVIRRARWTGLVGEDAALHECLCGLMEDTPFFDAAWHAAMRLELSLRDPALPRPHPGITHADNTDPRIREIGRKLRTAFSQWESTRCPTDRFAGYMPPPKETWTRLSPEEKMSSLLAVIAQALSELGRSADSAIPVKLDHLYRVVIDMPGIPAQDRQHVLMQLEIRLNRQIDPALRLYQMEMVDQNKLRRL